MTTPADKPDDLPRDLGEQPLTKAMADRGLKPHDLVAAAPKPITHKMVQRAMKGRRLTTNTMNKVVAAFGAATETEPRRADLFNYRP